MTFLFYDLETSGINARWQRIMQFGAQRTDENLNPVGEPIEHLIALTGEILPEPGAIMVHGITPQQTIREGMSEADFWKEIYPEFVHADTCIVGFNNLRFDDEFIRQSLWRNLRDPYSWSWDHGNSRWDLLDVVRMTRALRPDGIKWPEVDGQPVNRLELLAEANGLEHTKAHTALSDVEATIALAKLIKKSQPKLWDWLLGIRTKKILTNFINEIGEEPFLYSSGAIPKENLHTSPVAVMGPTSRNDGVWVFDLRKSPKDWLSKTEDQLRHDSENGERWPMKTLQFNKCPAVAPMTVLDEISKKRLDIDEKLIAKHAQEIKNVSISEILPKLTALREERWSSTKNEDPDGALYDGFLPDSDKALAGRIANAPKGEIAEMNPDFSDARMKEMFIRFKARNYPELLLDSEKISWESYRQNRLHADYGMNIENFSKALADLAKDNQLVTEKGDLLTELQLYAQSITQ